MNNHHEHEGHNESLSERILGRIGSEHIAPRSRLVFTAENWLFWTLGALAIALGALASAAVLFELANTSWSFYADTHEDLFTFVLAAAPFLWLLVLALFILIGYENIRRTKRGYRYPFVMIVAGAVLTSVALGTGVFAAGFGQQIEEAIGDHPPFYRPILTQEHAAWLHPAQGLIGGEVLGVASSSDAFLVKDFNGEVWTVDADDLATSSVAVLERGGTVRIKGVPSPSASSTLYACAAYSWETYGAYSSEAPRPPVGLPHLRNERIVPATRIQVCKGTRPYGSPPVTPGE